MPSAPQSPDRTRAFARLLGPWLVIVPGIIAIRAPDMGALAADFFRSDLFVWFAGALLVFGGLLIIAYHQYWSSLAAVLISLFGWVLLIRGVALMAAPSAYQALAASMSSLALIRLLFGVLVAIGAFLTWTGWKPQPQPAP